LRWEQHMRRMLIMAVAALIVMGSVAQGQKWFRRYGGYGQATPVQQLVNLAFSLPREKEMDDWAWRDAVESRLAGLGREALPLLALEANRRKGYEADAARVAIFRIENDINPRAALELWAEKQNLADVKLRRIMGLRDLLPHHLMYVVEFAPQAATTARERRVVAVAADTKVQLLSDDAALGRFLGIELAPARVDAMRENVAELTCRVAAARHADLTEVSSMYTQARPLEATAEMKAATLSGRADVAFTPDGHVTTLHTEFMKSRAAAVKLPPTRSPPTMPQ